MAGNGKVFNLDELSKHSSSQDCWLLIDGKVMSCSLSEVFVRTSMISLCNFGNKNRFMIDVTKFLNDHPGGDDVLLLATGKDATDAFEEVGHSSSAKAMLHEFYVGDLNIDSTTKANDTIAAATTTTTTPNQTDQQNQDKKNSELLSINVLQFLVPLIFLGLALGVRFYIKTPSSP